MGNFDRWIHLAMRLVYPQRCPVCDDIVPFDEGEICQKCRRRIVYIREPRCRTCGKQLIDETKLNCQDCERKTHQFSYGYGLYDYQNMKQALYRFKYQGRAEYAAFFAADLYRHFGANMQQMKLDAIIPVPLHADRQRSRGYNQAFEIAKRLSKLSYIPLEAKLVKRVKNTVPQKLLDEAGRQNNLKKAFFIGSDVVKLERVLIVDDIYTTGSTIDAIAGILKKHGVKEVFFLALTIGEGL